MATAVIESLASEHPFHEVASQPQCSDKKYNQLDTTPKFKDELIHQATARLRRRVLEERLLDVLNEVSRVQALLETVRIEAITTTEAVSKASEGDDNEHSLGVLEKRLATHEQQLYEISHPSEPGLFQSPSSPLALKSHVKSSRSLSAMSRLSSLFYSQETKDEAKQRQPRLQELSEHDSIYSESDNGNASVKSASSCCDYSSIADAHPPGQDFTEKDMGKRRRRQRTSVKKLQEHIMGRNETHHLSKMRLNPQAGGEDLDTHTPLPWIDNDVQRERPGRHTTRRGQPIEYPPPLQMNWDAKYSRPLPYQSSRPSALSQDSFSEQNGRSASTPTSSRHPQAMYHASPLDYTRPWSSKSQQHNPFPVKSPLLSAHYHQPDHNVYQGANSRLGFHNTHMYGDAFGTHDNVLEWQSTLPYQEELASSPFDTWLLWWMRYSSNLVVTGFRWCRFFLVLSMALVITACSGPVEPTDDMSATFTTASYS